MTNEEIINFSVPDAQYAVNEAYARHGASFHKKDVEDTFSNFTWYKPIPRKYADDVRKLMGSVEGANIDALSKHLGQLRNQSKNLR